MKSSGKNGYLGSHIEDTCDSLCFVYERKKKGLHLMDNKETRGEEERNMKNNVEHKERKKERVEGSLHHVRWIGRAMSGHL